MMLRTTLFLLMSTATSEASLLRGLQFDPSSLSQEQIDAMTPEEVQQEEQYLGCFCPCALPDGKEGVLIHTKDTAQQMYLAGQTEKVEASHVLCVDDLLSIEFNSQGRATCDEECWFFEDDDEETADEESEEDDLFGLEDSDEDEEDGEEEDDLFKFEDSEEEDESSYDEGDYSEDLGDYIDSEEGDSEEDYYP